MKMQQFDNHGNRNPYLFVKRIQFSDYKLPRTLTSMVRLGQASATNA